ncbi:MULTISPECIES: hypothetical protein [Bacillus cereus group]|uniref:hypothetical protein n=1 Tax=Bacillus cereus group TaxID=86661 RepID=UPI001596955B|nr:MULTISPECIES: hypothetical protein [Bacillus cereus group]MEB4819556.1 hypothetical protein [Bacillus thuringiensis]
MKLAYDIGYSGGWRDATDNVLGSRIEMIHEVSNALSCMVKHATIQVVKYNE